MYDNVRVFWNMRQVLNSYGILDEVHVLIIADIHDNEILEEQLQFEHAESLWARHNHTERFQ